MKKLAITIAIVLGLGMTTFADGGGLFQRGANPEQENSYFNGNRPSTGTPALPNHGLEGNQNAETPVGSGIAVLIGLGGAYLVAKKRKK